MVEWAALEMRCAVRYLGFESLPLRTDNKVSDRLIQSGFRGGDPHVREGGATHVVRIAKTPHRGFFIVQTHLLWLYRAIFGQFTSERKKATMAKFVVFFLNLGFLDLSE